MSSRQCFRQYTLFFLSFFFCSFLCFFSPFLVHSSNEKEKQQHLFTNSVGVECNTNLNVGRRVYCHPPSSLQKKKKKAKLNWRRTACRFFFSPLFSVFCFFFSLFFPFLLFFLLVLLTTLNRSSRAVGVFQTHILFSSPFLWQALSFIYLFISSDTGGRFVIALFFFLILFFPSVQLNIHYYYNSFFFWLTIFLSGLFSLASC